MDSLEFTLQFIRAHSLRAILLESRQKRPPTGKFPITQDPSEILEHLHYHGNIGILAGPIAILDFDDMGLAQNMFLKLGPLQPTVQTGTGKVHCYVKSVENIPARMNWNGQRVGEIQRGYQQYVVAPPSIHPNGNEYKWLLDSPREPLIDIPERWMDFLFTEMIPEVPEELKKYIGVDFPEEIQTWTGPPAEELLRLAMMQPGARRRTFGVKFQCPQCRAEGHDKSKDNAIVANSGKWGCAFSPDDPVHKRSIGEALGVFVDLQDTANKLVEDCEVSKAVDQILEKTFKDLL